MTQKTLTRNNFVVKNLANITGGSIRVEVPVVKQEAVNLF